ncbi:MAG: rod-binding protein [Acidaminococcales bacterium]|jgi:flagellar protein FlgJ|nr:rod-binding protein [Acidaminococcales bacterium]
MADIFAGGLGGMRVMRSATSDVNLAKGKASVEAAQDEAFAQKLRAAEEKIEAGLATAPDQAAKDGKLREVCREMEAVFLNMLLGKMRDTVPERTLFPKSSGEKMMQSMLDVELTRVMAAGGGVGLGELLYRQLSGSGRQRLPEGANAKE